MDRQKLMIKSPCNKDFDEMEGDGYRRFCDHCNKHVHNLSDLTRAEAIELLRENADSGLCVIYTFDPTNRVRFKESMPLGRAPKKQLNGLKRLLAAAALVPLLAGLPGCDTAAESEVPVWTDNAQPCDLGSANTFRPIDAIMAAEREFVAALEELLGFGPNVDYVTAGEPAIDPSIYEPDIVEPADPDEFVMGKIAYEPEPEHEPASQPTEAFRVEPQRLMGDMAAPLDAADELESELLTGIPRHPHR